MPRWTTETRRDRGVFHELADWWDSQPAAVANPLLNTRILGCWEDGFDEPSSKLHVVLLRRDSELVAALPLYRARGRVRTLSRFFASSTDVVAVADREVAARVPAWIDSLRLAHLYRIPEESPVVSGLGAYPRWKIQAEIKCPYIVLSGGMGEVQSGLSSSFKRGLRRGWRRLGEMGDVRFEGHVPGGEVSSVLEAGLRLEASGWKGKQGVAVLSSPTRARWLRSVAERAVEEGWLCLSALYLDERMISFCLDLEYGRRRNGMMSTYDESADVAPVSPGRLLIDCVIRDAIPRGIESYELGYGGHSWKYNWTTTDRTVYDILILGSGTVGRLVAGIKTVKDRSRSLRNR